MVRMFALFAILAAMFLPSQTHAQRIQERQLTPEQLKMLDETMAKYNHSALTIACKTQDQAEKFLEIYYSTKLNFGQVI